MVVADDSHDDEGQHQTFTIRDRRQPRLGVVARFLTGPCTPAA
jgi:hypothetical protein